MANPKKIIQYYADEQLQKPLTSLDFGRTLQGERKTMTIYVYNTLSDFSVELDQPQTTDNDLHIKDYPSILKPNTKDKLVLEFSPSPDRITPLRGGWDFRKTVF